MTISIDNFEVFLLIIARISGFIFTAPFFSLKNMPMRVKTGLAISLASIIFYTVSFDQLEYVGVIGYTVIVIKEALAGVIMGFFANIAYYILSFSGQIIDMEIGFSMVQEMDPTTHIQSTITANLYGYLIILIMMITNLHHHFIEAIVDSFEAIGVGNVNLNPDLYLLMVQFITDFFIIGFRIVLPVFGAILVVNTILAILAKMAPQMNMFVIGMQVKVAVGLVGLALMIGLVPFVADMIYNEMVTMLRGSIELLR